MPVKALHDARRTRTHHHLTPRQLSLRSALLSSNQPVVSSAVPGVTPAAPTPASRLNGNARCFNPAPTSTSNKVMPPARPAPPPNPARRDAESPQRAPDASLSRPRPALPRDASSPDALIRSDESQAGDRERTTAPPPPSRCKDRPHSRRSASQTEFEIIQIDLASHSEDSTPSTPASGLEPVEFLSTSTGGISVSVLSDGAIDEEDGRGDEDEWELLTYDHEPHPHSVTA
ncbi:hypothetical protein JCM10212_000567 [Sporobolomyces blumeae]